MVKDIVGSAYNEASQSSAINSFAATESYLFFLTAPAIFSYSQPEFIVAPNTPWTLWRTDGTSDDTVQVLDLAGYTRHETSPQAGSQWLYLFANKDERTYLFRTDGNQTTPLDMIPLHHSVVAQAIGSDDTFFYATGESAQKGITLWSVTPQATTPRKVWESSPLATTIQNTILHVTTDAIYLIVHPQGQAPTLYVATYASSTLSPLRTLDAWPSVVSHSTNYLYYFVTSNEDTQLWRSSGTLTDTVSIYATEPVTAVKTFLLTWTDESQQEQIYYTMTFVGGGFLPKKYMELWHSDGTAADPQFLNTYSLAFPISAPFRHQDKIYIEMASFDPSGPEYTGPATDLYVSDGTPAGSHPFADFQGEYPIYALLGDYLLHDNAQNGVDAYPGDLRFANFATGEKGAIDLSYSQVSNIINKNPWTTFKDVLYFSATNGIDGIELWRSDATQSGTWQLKNINTTAVPPQEFEPTYAIQSLAPTELTASDQLLYFVADTGRNGPHLYRSDGTAAGTYALDYPALLNEWTDPTALMTDGNMLYFIAVHRTQKIEVGEWWEWGPNYGLWQSDGTTAGTRLLVDQIASPINTLAMVNHRLLILGQVSSFSAWELWRLNETQDGLELLFDFNLEPPGSGVYDANPFVATANYILFQNGDVGSGLWRSDGTQVGTYRLNGYAAERLVAGNTLVYGMQRNPSFNTAFRYWRTDGKNSGTYDIKNFAAQDDLSSQPFNEITIGDRLYFTFSKVNQRTQLWTSTGTRDDSQLLAEFANVPTSYAPTIGMTADRNALYLMEVYDPPTQSPKLIDLWRSDGTTNSTYLINRYQVSRDHYPFLVMAHNDQVFFAINKSQNEAQLFRTSNNSPCTFLVANVNIAGRNVDSFPLEYAKVGNLLYFVATDSNGDELWVANLPGPIECHQNYLPSTMRH